MTTNHARAAQIINAAHIESARDLKFPNPSALAQALVDAGLITPDRVEPSGDADHSPWWFYLGDQVVGTSGHGDVGMQHTVVTHDEDGSPAHSERWIDLTPDDARHLAAILLAAAAHATQEKK